MTDIPKIEILSPTIRLDQFLKWSGVVMSGSEGKNLIIRGLVSVNGKKEIRRGRTLRAGDLVSLVDGPTYKISFGGE